MEYQTDFRFPLLDLTQLDDTEISGSPILQSTLRLLKYSRSQQLVGILGEVLRLIVQAIPDNHLPAWIKAIGVYVMAVNEDFEEEEFRQTLKSVLPVRYVVGSLADRLLIRGREEGKLAGKILMLQELLGDTPTTDAEFDNCDAGALTSRLAELQLRLRDRRS